MKYLRAENSQRFERRFQNFNENSNTPCAPSLALSSPPIPFGELQSETHFFMCFYVALMMEELEIIKEPVPGILSHMQDTVSLLKVVCDSTLLSHVMR